MPPQSDDPVILADDEASSRFGFAGWIPLGILLFELLLILVVFILGIICFLTIVLGYVGLLLWAVSLLVAFIISVSSAVVAVPLAIFARPKSNKLAPFFGLAGHLTIIVLCLLIFYGQRSALLGNPPQAYPSNMPPFSSNPAAPDWPEPDIDAPINWEEPANPELNLDE